MTPADFRRDLAWGESTSVEPFWEATYRKAFPGFSAMVRNDGRNVAQYRGIDRIVLLTSGAVLRIDEKRRRKDYGDVLLEVVANDARGEAGWMEQDLEIDYLAYGKSVV